MQKEIDRLINSYRSNALSKEEAGMLAGWLEESDENRAYFRECLARRELPASAKAEREWARFAARNKILFAVPEVAGRRRSRFLRYVAAAAVVAAGVCAVWFWQRTPDVASEAGAGAEISAAQPLEYRTACGERLDIVLPDGPKLRGFFRSRQTGRAPQKRLRLVRAVVKIGFYAKFAVSCRKLETMTQQLRFIPFKSRSDKGWAEAWALYEASFPDCERWDGTGYDRAFGDPHFEADGIWRGDEFIGILFHWNAGDYRYVEHLAVSPRLRGQNMGSKALAAFCQGRRVILEIDPPEDEISVRRQHFYQRLGFVANPYAYIHPSFRRPFHPHRLVLMSYPEALTYEEARGFADFIRERVLRYSEHENPELPRL